MPVVRYRPMKIEDFDGLVELWRNTPGVGVTQRDNPDGFQFFLERNPGLSFIAESGGQIVGGVMCGHDGRNGYLHHLVVYTPFRRQGIARTLVQFCLDHLDQIGVQKCHLFIHRYNTSGLKFWESIGWTERLELTMASYTF